MTRNLRTQLANAAERWMRAWAGDELARESAEVLYTYWDLADPGDDELRAEVLSRFSPAEPPAVAGLDFLPAGDCPSMFQDRKEPIYLYPCRRGKGHAGKHHSRDLVHSWTDAEQYIPSSPDVEQDAKTIVAETLAEPKQHGLGSADKGSDGLYRRCLCGAEFTGRDLADLADQIMAHERAVTP